MNEIIGHLFLGSENREENLNQREAEVPIVSLGLSGLHNFICHSR